MFESDPARTAYGLQAVMYAVSSQAVAELLITDKVYRTDDFQERNKFVDLMEEVQNAGGKVFKFSSMHVSGEKLDCFTGIAATLRFSVEIAEVEEDEHEKAIEALTIAETKPTVFLFDGKDNASTLSLQASQPSQPVKTQAQQPPQKQQKQPQQTKQSSQSQKKAQPQQGKQKQQAPKRYIPDEYDDDDDYYYDDEY